MPVRYKYHHSLSFTQAIRLGTVWAFRSSRYQGYRTMFVFSVPRLLSRRCHNISSIPWAFCILLCPLLTSVTRWAHLAVRSVPDGTRNGSPGVIPATFDARLSDIPSAARQRITGHPNKVCLCKCLSRMTGNCHVRFLGGPGAVRP